MISKELALAAMQKEMARLRAYFPYRIVWGALNPQTNEYVTGATAARHQPNNLARKGQEVYLYQ